MVSMPRLRAVMGGLTRAELIRRLAAIVESSEDAIIVKNLAAQAYRGEAAAEDETIPSGRKAHVFDHVVVLVRPEGMEIVIGLVAAQHRAGRGAPLLVAVVPVLDAQAAEDRVQMVCDVARRVDVG